MSSIVDFQKRFKAIRVKEMKSVKDLTHIKLFDDVL
jgi:hypothetical protein